MGTVQPQDRGREKVKDGYSTTPGQRNRKRDSEGWVQSNRGQRNRKRGIEGKTQSDPKRQKDGVGSDNHQCTEKIKIEQVR
jgi:hypothetical protein